MRKKHAVLKKNVLYSSLKFSLNTTMQCLVSEYGSRFTDAKINVQKTNMKSLDCIEISTEVKGLNVASIRVSSIFTM